MAIVGSACANNDDGVEQSLLTSPYDAENAAETVLSAALRFNSAVHSSFALVKDDVKPGTFVLFDEIQHALQQAGVSTEHTVERAAEQILEHMLMAEEDQLAANVYALLSRFADLISQPRESIPPRLLGACLTDSIDLTSELRVKLTRLDPDRKQRAYYFAPAYNVVVNALSFAYAADGAPRTSIEYTYHDAIKANMYLVGSGEGDDLGYLSDWIAEHTAGSASARMKYEKDPIVFSVRRALEEQQSALE